ncbi:putative type II restriction endonuclease [Rhodobacter sp. AKP1]|nr:putative type II restriction endonuclease [Rhodobacter sp. AKP1]
MSYREIGRGDVLKAIDEFDNIGRDAFLEKYGFGRSRSYFLSHNGKLYDSKAIVGSAHQHASPAVGSLAAENFSGGEATVKKLLEALDFEVYRTPAVANGELEQRLNEHSGYWWVNHKQTYEHEVNGSYIWSPTTRRDGGRNEFYENMKRVRVGDIIFSYADAKVKAIGVCTAPAALVPKPKEFGSAGHAWSDEGWLIAVDFQILEQPLRPKDHMDKLAPLLPTKYSPIRENGSGNQGAYLAEISSAMADELLLLLGRPVLGPLEMSDDQVEQASELADATAEHAIRNRTDIGPTEKLQLCQSRRGQGIYRKNLQGFERGCRVTGVTDATHLKASHIKPWRACSNFERLDGNNGLLLSPHVDHLFDRGFISFENCGRLIISSSLHLAVLSAWGIQTDHEPTPFRPEQATYLAYHREFIFSTARGSRRGGP